MQLELSHLINALPGMVWTALPDGRAELLNRRWCEYTGLSLEEAIGFGWQGAIHPDDRSGLLEGWRLFVESGQPGELQTRLRRHDGTYRRFLVSTSPITDASGHVVKWCGINTDIEEVVKTQELLLTRKSYYDSVIHNLPQGLHEDERYARLIVDSIPCLVAVFTPNGDVEHVNRQVLDYFGTSSEDLADWRFRDMAHPEDLSRAIELFGQAMATGDAFEFEVRARRYDGIYRWFQSRGLPLRDQSGRIVRWYNLLIDIDERKRAEEALAARAAELRRAHYHLSEGQRLSQTGSFTADPAVDEHTWSEEFNRICEFEPGSKASIQKLRDIVDPRDVALFDHVIQRGLVGDDFDFVFRIVTPKSGLKHLRGVGRVVEQLADRPLFVGAIQDVTASKLAEEALKSREEELQRAYYHLSEAQRLSQTGSFIWDVQADEHSWSAEIHRIFGFEAATKVTMALIQSAIHPQDRPTVEAVIGRAAQGIDFDLVFRIIARSGEVKYAHVVGHRTEQETGRLVFLGAIQDVTESKLAEEALRAREAALQRAHYHLTEGQRLSQTGSFSADPVADEHTWSDELYRICDLEPGSEVTFQKFRGMVHTEDLSLYDAVIEGAVVGRNFDVVLRIVTSKGTLKHVRGVGRVVERTEGRPMFVGAVQDVTDSKLAEEALKARQAELRRAQYHLTEGQRLSQTGSFTSDPTADEHTWSDEFYRICEFEPDRTPTIQNFRDIVHHEDRPLYDAVIEQAQTGRDFDVVFRIVTPKGTLKHVRGVGRVVEQIAGRPVFVGAIQDVTASKLVEEALKTRAAELRRAYEFLNEGQRLSGTGSFITDLVAEEHNWSEELFRMFEIDPSTKVTVQLVRERVQPEDLPSFDEGIERSMKGADFDLIFRIRTPRGSTKHLHAVAHVVEEVAGRPLFVGAIQDVTESKLAEQALNMARTELAHVSRAMTLGTLTASIAHEVNQPLAGIITNANTCLHMLAVNPPNLEGVRTTAQRMLRDGNRAAEVIQRLRTLFSRKEPKKEPVDLNDAAREVLAMSSNELQRGGVILRTDFDESVPPVTGDRVQLQQVILNLVLNAADAMIKVTERPRDLLVATAREEADRVRLWVRDSGVGIDSKSPEKLFEPFYTTKSHGMGVGLSISRSIIESHQGRLWASANEGAGATFSFSVPCRVWSTSGTEGDGG